MKKHISININPVENGYTIQAQSSDANGQNAKGAMLVATTDEEAESLATSFIESTFLFNPPATPASSTSTSSP